MAKYGNKWSSGWMPKSDAADKLGIGIKAMRRLVHKGKSNGCHPMRKSGRKVGRPWKGYVVSRSSFRKLMEERGLAAGE